jgi:septal ring factor EnvC (AmiA/AmiB activator)
MDYMAFAKKYALQIAVAIVLLIVASIIYDRFLSDEAKFVGYLKDQIEEKDKELEELREEYEKLSEEEQKRLQEIAALKSQVADLRNQISAGEVNIDAIKNDIIEIDEAIAIIEENTRGTVARSRSVLAEDSTKPKPN